MGSLFISLLTLVLILVSGFVILLVLMQRTSQSGGMGAALGGGAAESAFGSDANNVLRNATIYSIIAFFLVSLGLFLIYQSKVAERTQPLDAEALISAEEPDTLGLNLAEGMETALEDIVKSTVDDEEALSILPDASEVNTDAEIPVEETAPSSE